MATPESTALLQSVADSIADGLPVDWQTVEAQVDGQPLRLLKQLRILSDLATLHRTLPTSSSGTTPALAARSKPATVIGKWGHLELIERLGGGASSEVYRAWDPQLECEVALKLLRVDDWSGDPWSSRLVREGRLLARVNHRHVIAVHGVAVQDGRFGLWMQLIRGANLYRLVVKQGPLSAREASVIGIDICQALAAVHGAGLIHRDVKAANVMREDGGRIVLMDLGMGSEREATRSGPNDFAGTPLYLAPEIFQGRQASVRTDLYGLGVLLYYLVTGSYPVRAATISELKDAHAKGAVVRLRDVRADLPTRFIQVVERATAVDPELRYPTAGAFEADLVRALDDASAPTSERRSRVSTRTKTLIAASIAALLVLGALGWRAVTNRPDAALAAATVRSIVVLPLENLSGDPSQEYFADGLTEVLISDLAQIHALRVISRTSAMVYKGAKKPLADIARELRVDAVLEGSVMRVGDRVRITADLVDASSDRHLWVQTYERDLKDVLTLQSDVAQAMAIGIQVQLTPQEKASFGAVQAVNPAAAEAYLRGRYEWNKRTNDSLQQALVYFQQAATIDPTFAKAYAGQADVYNMLPSSLKVSDSQSSPLVMYPLAKATAMKALGIDSTLAEAHASLGYARWFSDRDSAAAENSFQRAIQLNPGYATAHQWYADYLLAVNRVDDSLREIGTAKTLDPLSNPVRVLRAAILYSARRYDEVIAQANEAIRGDPINPGAFYYRAVAYEQKGLLVEAENSIREAIRLAPRDSFYLQELGRVAARKGDRAEAERIIRELAAPGHPAGTTAGPIGFIYAALSNTNRAFAFLTQAEREHWPALLWARTLPELDPLRNDPRFADLLRALNLSR